MSLYRERRIMLLLFAVFISGMLIWKPWGGLDLQARGLRFGVDAAGGSRTIIELRVSHVTIETDEENLDAAWEHIRSALEGNLNTLVALVSQNENAGQLVVEIGKSVTRAFVQNIIGDLGTVVSVQGTSTSATQNEAVTAFQARLDSYGLLGMQFRTLGENLVLFDSAGLDPDRTEELLTTQGRLEMSIDNRVVITNDDVGRFDAPTASRTVAHLPIKFTDEGLQKFNSAVSEKAGHPMAVYLDRPFDSILVFDNAVVDELSDLAYDENRRRFYSTSMGYALLVSAIGTPKDNISSEALEYLESQAGVKLSAILLGAATDFSTGVIENIAQRYRIEYIPQLGGEDADEWVHRACGVKSVSPIDESIAEEGVQEGLGIPILGSSSADALQKARDLRVIWSNRVPAETSIVSEAEVGAQLGTGFMREVLIAGAVALIGISLLIYWKHRRWKICFAIICITLFELMITLGAASVLGLTIGLAELTGVFVVISTGINHQLIMTDEMLRGGLPQAKKVSVGWRASRALLIIYVAIFLTIAAMIPIGWFVYGSIRGFAIITITGMILALLLTRPAYARIIDRILAG